MTDSSVVLRGIDARTFSEMESFVKDLEARPVERLLRDLAHLAELPQTKVSLVSYVMYSKFRAAEAAEKNRMRESVAVTFEALTPGETKDRIGQILERMR
jgi:predicted homoserine dehydrogenase-like protein